MMNRRDFLKLLGAALAATVAPVIIPGETWTVTATANNSAALPPAPDLKAEIGRLEGVRFIESREHGGAVSVYGEPSEVLVRDVKDLLLKEARKHLPSGTRFVVLAYPPVDWGRRHDFAWYYAPNLEARVSGWVGREVIGRAIA